MAASCFIVNMPYEIVIGRDEADKKRFGNRGNRDRWVEVFGFFQAEDGIRDVAVTGVQTCALPISEERWRRWARNRKYVTI